MDFGSPHSVEELLISFEKMVAIVEEKIGALSEEQFQVSPRPEDWNPTQHLDHLVRSVSPVARALGTPKATLKRIFGMAENTSRVFDALQAVYTSELSNGGVSSGRFSPEEKGRVAPDKLLTEFRTAAEDFKNNLAAWDEAALEKYQIPHPLIGNLTVREMVMFTIYHCWHHANDVEILLQEI